MPAKLDITKPLRIIGVQIFENTQSVVKKNLDPGWYPFIKCINNDQIGTSRDVFPIVSDDVCPLNYYTIDDNLPRISVSAIAGKNGSGKSSLIDIVYRFINNFAENTFLMRGLDETDEVGHAFGIEGRLHFEMDGVQKFIESTDAGTFYYEIVDGELDKITKSIVRKNAVKAQRPYVNKTQFDNLVTLFRWSSNKWDRTFHPNKQYRQHFDLDHVLPKSECGFVALSLYNLVPSCPICNQRLKKTRVLGVM